MIASGKTIKEIAAEHALSEKTVGTYRQRIAKKMGLNSNVDLTRYAMKHHLVDKVLFTNSKNISASDR